jgi:transposase InsO family protein
VRIDDAQARVDAWREDYNTMRPHQSLNIAFPAARCATAAGDGGRSPGSMASRRSSRD